MTTDEKIVEYGKSMDLHNDPTVELLIESHKNLRKEFQKTNADRIAEIIAARKRATEDARIYALTHEFISREALRKMTVSEMVALLHEEFD